MKRRNRITSTLFALLLSLSLVVTYLPASMIAYATEGSDTTVEQIINTDDLEIDDESEGEQSPADDIGIESAEEEGEDASDIINTEDDTEELGSESLELLSASDDDEATEEEPVVRAKASSGDTVLLFSSDVHNQSNNTASNRMGTMIDIVRAKAGEIDAFGMCGDMGDGNASEANFYSYSKAVMDSVEAKGVEGVYTTGNHEFYNGNFSSSNNSLKSRFIVGDVGKEGDNYIIYCMGTTNWNNSQDNFTTEQINSLESFLSKAGNDKPIFVLVHFPLHRYSYRSTTNADKTIDVLNAAAASGKKIVLLWGHNHSSSDTNYDQIYKPGDTITYNSSGSSKEIQFYYGAAGCGSDSEYNSGSAYVKGKALAVTINSKDQLSFTYYDENANNVTEGGGTFTEQDPVFPTSISVAPETLVVEEGRTSTLSVSYEPADTNQKGITWSSEDESIAKVTNGRVKGISEGTTTIIATSADGKCTATCQVNVTPSLGTQVNYIIKIGNYVLSTERSSDSSNGGSSGGGWGGWGSTNTYTGMDAVDYSSATGNDENISWIIEETDGGYYIMSQDGRYLNATYSSSGSSYNSSSTSDLKLDDTEDVWVLDDGVDLDSWEVDGSYLKSSNTGRYLCEETGTNGTHLFSVRSKENADKTTIEDAGSLGEEVKATAIAVSPKTTTVQAGSTRSLSVTFTPDNTTNKKVTWSSSDTSVATVSSSGTVTGVAKGTATITATYSDGVLIDTCEVTVTKAAGQGVTPEDGKKYVILANDGYALTSEGSETGYSNGSSGQQQYNYLGLEGEEYTVGEDVTPDHLLWTFTESEDGTGFYIQSNKEEYLSGTYVSNDSGGYDAKLSLGNTRDIWIISGATSDSSVSAHILKSTNASQSDAGDKYLTHGNGENSGENTNIFTLRSEDNATSTTFYEYTDEGTYVSDPDDPTPEDPSTGETIEIAPESGSNAPEKSATINAGDTLTINVTNNSTRSDYDYTLTLSETGIALIEGSSSVNIAAGGTGQFKVKGLANGTVDVNISNNNSNSERKGTIHLTVVDGDTPVNPPAPADGDRYEEVSSLESGKEYIIAVTKDDGSVYAIRKGSSSVSSTTLAVTAASGDTPAYITTDDASVLWEYTSDKYLINDGDYFYPSSSNGIMTYSSGRAIDYTDGTMSFSTSSSGTYYITCSNGSFSTSSSSSNAAEIRLFAKTDGSDTPDDPPTPSDGTTYKMVDKFTSGKDYLIVSSNSAGSAYALTNPGGSSSGASIGRTAVTIKSGDADDDGTTDIYISTDEAAIVWTTGSEVTIHSDNYGDFGTGYDLENSSPGGYLEGKGGDVKVYSELEYTTSTDRRGWQYTENQQLQHVGGRNTYILRYSDSGFTSTYNSTSDKLYIYEKTESVTGEDPVTSVTLNKSEITLIEGTSETLTATVLPATAADKTVTWSTSDQTVATVDQTGKVTAVKEGKATITVTTTDGEKTATCAVTVEAAPPAPEATKYKLTDKLEAGKDYLIVNVAEVGSSSSRALKNPGGSSAGVTPSTTTVEVLEGNIIEISDTDIVWTATAKEEGVHLTNNGSDYLEIYQGNLRIYNPVKQGARYWTYSDNHLTHRGGSNPYYVGYSNGAFAYSSSAKDIYLFVKVEEGEHTHTWNAGVVTTDATCTEPGVKTFTCTECGETQTEAIAATGHTPETDAAVAATCTETGLTEGSHCSVCGIVLAAQETVAALGHSWNDGEVTTEPSCTEDGVKTYTCNIDNTHTKTEGIPATGHTPVTDAAVAATCTETGLTEGSHCSVCDIVLVAQETVAALGHSWNDGEVTTEPSCTEDGVKTFICNNDSKHTKTEAIAATGHTPVTDAAVAATCTETGLTEGSHCSVCDTVLVAQETVAALGHNYGIPEYVWSVDHSKVAARVVCTVCEDEVMELVEATSATTEATCETAGRTVYTTSAFKHEAFSVQTETIEIPALGHAWSEWTITKEATETAEGEETRTCSRCDAAETRTIPKADHVHRLTAVEAMGATCTEPGNSAYWNCDQGGNPCGRYFSDAEGTTDIEKDSWIIPANGHSYGAAEYVWSVDHDKVTARAACTACEESTDGHEIIELVGTTGKTTEATCEEAGKTVYTTNAFKHELFSEQTEEVELPALGHNWSEWTITKEATETSEGEETRTCSRCDAAETRIIPLEEHVHNLTAVEAKEATCTESGNIAYWICDQGDNPCGRYFSDSEGKEEIAESETAIPALGHAWGKWTVTRAATEEAEGIETRICSHCGESDARPIPKLQPGSDPNKKSADGTAVGPGASAAAAEKAITSMTSDADISGVVFGKLMLRSPKQGNTSINLSWSGVSGASRYILYGNKCGKSNKPVKLMTTTGSSVSLGGLAKGTYYKYILVALNSKNEVVSTSKLIHVATKGGKVGNHKSVKVTKAVTKKAKKLKVGKSLKLKAKAVAQSKKLKVKKHVAVRYESSNPKIATVTSGGKVVAKSKGTCYVYAYAQNGVYKAIKITVK